MQWLASAYRLVLRAGEKREDEENAIPLNWLRYVGRRRSRLMTEAERDYFQGRAEAELALAGEAAHPAAARSHRMLAAYYLDLVTCASSGEGRTQAAA